MSQTELNEDFERMKAMVELEEVRGPIVPGGAQGGVIARAHRAAAQREGKEPANPSAAGRARGRVRFLFRAREKHTNEAA